MMDWRQRLLGPRQLPETPWQQLSDTVETLRTGESPDVRRAAESGFGAGYVHAWQGLAPAVPIVPPVELPPIRTGWSARVLGRVAPPPAPQQLSNALEWLQTGQDPNVRIAGEAGYQAGYVQGITDRPPVLSVDILARLRGT